MNFSRFEHRVRGSGLMLWWPLSPCTEGLILAWLSIWSLNITALFYRTQKRFIDFQMWGERKICTQPQPGFCFLYFHAGGNYQLTLLWMTLCLGSLLDGSMAAKDEHREGRCAESQSGLHKNEDSWTSTVDVDVDPLSLGTVDESDMCLSLATCGNSARRQSWVSQWPSGDTPAFPIKRNRCHLH